MEEKTRNKEQGTRNKNASRAPIPGGGLSRNKEQALRGSRAHVGIFQGTRNKEQGTGSKEQGRFATPEARWGPLPLEVNSSLPLLAPSWASYWPLGG